MLRQAQCQLLCVLLVVLRSDRQMGQAGWPCMQQPGGQPTFGPASPDLGRHLDQGKLQERRGGQLTLVWRPLVLLRSAAQINRGHCSLLAWGALSGCSRHTSGTCRRHGPLSGRQAGRVQRPSHAPACGRAAPAHLEVLCPPGHHALHDGVCGRRPASAWGTLCMPGRGSAAHPAPPASPPDPSPAWPPRAP